MTQPVTVLAPIKLAKGKTEADLIAASDQFEKDFVSQYPAVLRREMICVGEGEYMDIVQFSSKEEAEEVIKAEMGSPLCAEFFSVMDMSNAEAELPFHRSVATY